MGGDLGIRDSDILVRILVEVVKCVYYIFRKDRIKIRKVKFFVKLRSKYEIKTVVFF